MSSDVSIGRLEVVDGRELPEKYRKILKPGETLVGGEGRRFRLPQYFYEVESWQMARNTEIAPSFGLYEFISTDVREAAALRGFPRYVPLALTHLAAHLAVLRNRVGTYVHVAANGGYRSPGHQAAANASVHIWGTAANIYRIGDDYLDSEDMISKYTEIVREVLPAVRIRPYGRQAGGTVDHLHVDLGRYVVAPFGAESDGDD